MIYFQKNVLITEAWGDIENSIKREQEISRDDLSYKTGNKKKSKAYDFQKLKTIRSFGREMYCGNIELNDAFQEQIKLKHEIDHFNQYSKPKSLEEKEEKVVTYENKNGKAKKRKAKNS